jgi:hypothetical protein
MQQLLTMRAMEQAEYEDKVLRGDQDRDRYAQLKQQMDEQKYKRQEWDKAKYGQISSGFFDGFGTSCR